MINYTTISTAFTNIVGFRENEDVPISTSLETSTSGLYVNDEAGMSLKTIYNSLYRYASTSLPDIDTYLTNRRNSAIRTVINEFVSKHKELTKSRTILDNIILPSGTPDELNTDKNDRLVGIKIKPKNSRHAAFLIKQIGYYFESNQTNFPVYMWVDGRKAYIKTTSIASITAKTRNFTDIQLLNWIAQFYSTYGANISFYIGYFESDLSGSAYNTSLNDGCNDNDVYMYKYTNFADICGFAVQNAYLDSTNLPDKEYIEFTDSTFGLYLWLNVECDITNIIIDNKNIFAKAINLKTAWDINEDLINSPNLGHRTETFQSKNAENNRDVLDVQYTRELKGITIDFTALDSQCLSNETSYFHTRTA